AVSQRVKLIHLLKEAICFGFITRTRNRQKVVHYLILSRVDATFMLTGSGLPATILQHEIKNNKKPKIKNDPFYS
ncbi:hypothetical protein ACEWBT_24005, partial [Vibrio parahaemolyticus]